MFSFDWPASNLPSSTTFGNATAFTNVSEVSATTTIGFASATVNLTQGTGSESYPKTTVSAGSFYWINSNGSNFNNNTTSKADSTTTALHGLNLSTVLNLTTLFASASSNTALNGTAENNVSSSLGLNSESANETTTVTLLASYPSESSNVTGWNLLQTIQNQSSDNETVVQAYTTASYLQTNNSNSSSSESTSNSPLLYENSSLVMDTSTISEPLNTTTTNSSSAFLSLSTNTALKYVSWTEWDTEEISADVLTTDFTWNTQTPNPSNAHGKSDRRHLAFSWTKSKLSGTGGECAEMLLNFRN